MASNIDITKPVQGQATTESVRANFAFAKAEIEALQNAPAGGDMLKSVYDTDLDGVVDEAERLTTNARNSTGALIPKGSIVYINGASGQNPTIALALANAKATSASTIGIVLADIANNAVGLISTAGKIHLLNTAAFAEGATVYLSPTVPGGITITKPVQPQIIVRIGFIAYSHAVNGLLILSILAGPDLDDNQVVLFTNKQNGDVLTYESASALWKNKPGAGGAVTLSGDLIIYVTQVKSYTITNYSAFATYAVAATAGNIGRVGDTITYTAPAAAQEVTLTVTMNGIPVAFPLTILPVGVETPVNTTPANGATGQSSSVQLTASAFQWLGVADTHASSDWQLATDSGFNTIVQSTIADAINKTTWTVTGLSANQTYYWRVRYTGAANGTSSWSTGTSFATSATFGGLIGVQGAQGFGVGVCPVAGWLTELNLTAMSGHDDPAHANYGNYQHSNAGIAAFIPRYYYRIGNAASPRFATYGANALDIVGIDTYATEAAANAAGYAMHRVFKDGGADKPGFFYDKYLASKDGTTSCKSVALGVPISLTTDNVNWTASNGMTGCTGILADAVVLSRARGAGWNNVSIFMEAALAQISEAQAQASTNTTFCAWWDATNNFPKGCNNGALADTNDAGVTFTTAGDVGSSAKPKTGSGSPFAKTTHNGQACGVADLNGSLYQVALGVTNPGTSGTDATQQANGNAYVLKASVALASLTSGWSAGAAGTDAWGDAAHLGLLYDNTPDLFPWGATTGWTYFGNGANQVFSGATSGTDWLQTGCGIQDTINGTSAGGTALFGADGCYQYNRANLFPLCAGYWGGAASAGVFCRYWDSYRSVVNLSCGFRAGAYGS